MEKNCWVRPKWGRLWVAFNVFECLRVTSNGLPSLRCHWMSNLMNRSNQLCLWFQSVHTNVDHNWAQPSSAEWRESLVDSILVFLIRKNSIPITQFTREIITEVLRCEGFYCFCLRCVFQSRFVFSSTDALRL